MSDVFDPQSPLARATVDLFNVAGIICGFILVLVTGLVVVCLLRFRGKPGDAEPAQLRGHKHLEITWTIIPILLLAVLTAFTMRAMQGSDPQDKKEPPEIVITGHQFWWEVRYPQSGVITANEVHIPTGRRVLVQLKTADVIHNFWVPELTRKMDMLPDRANQIWLQANHPGSYHGACSEFCGTQHAWMRILVIAHSPDEYSAWQKSQLQPVATPPPEVRRGAELFQRLTCVNCHAVGSPAAKLQAGPDLTHFGSRRTLGAGILANTPENLTRWMKNPQTVKPGNLMPNLQLTESQLADMVAYLRSLK